MKGTGVDVIGLDWTVDMADGRKRLGSGINVQGNVDPAYLFSPLDALTDEIQRSVHVKFCYKIHSIDWWAMVTFMCWSGILLQILPKIYIELSLELSK